MAQPRCCGARRTGAVSVGYQNDIRVHDRFDSRPQRIDIDRRQNHTDCRPAAVSGNQDRNLFMRQTSFGGLASPAARLARKVSFALLALQNTGFISFHNAREPACFRVFCGEKAVPPTEGGIDGKPATFCRSTNRQPIGRTGSKGKPPVLAVQARQGGAGCRIECLPASLASIPSQTPCLATRYGSRCAAMRAPATFTHTVFYRSQGSRCLRSPRKPGFGLLPLRRAGLVYPGQPFLKLPVIHGDLSL